jgi:NAD(P)-dependent dehydrogenase (short-subunit alcohol dehydrogenase family)
LTTQIEPSTVPSIAELSGLDGRRALVVGAGMGIGRETARLLARAGVNVALIDLDAARVADLADELRAAGRTSAAIAADVTEPGTSEALIAQAWEAMDGLDILVNIVGGATGSAYELLEMPETAFAHMMDLNYRHQVGLSVAFARRLIADGRPGTIALVSSSCVLAPFDLMGAYAPAKAALVSAARTMAREWGRYGIRVNTVAPGITRTDRVALGLAIDELAADAVPLMRVGDQREVAATLLFLVSDLSSYVTGQTILHDGGAALVQKFTLPRQAIATPNTRI